MAKHSSDATPESIQVEIEHTRAELAETLDALVDRVSPKRVADRSKVRAKEALQSALETVRPTPHEVALPDGSGTTYTTQRSVRWDRVAAAGGVVIVVAGFLIYRHRH